MALVFTLLFLLSATFLIIGFFLPEGSLFWYRGKKTRARSAIIYGVFATLTLIVSVATMPENVVPKPSSSTERTKQQPIAETKQVDQSQGDSKFYAVADSALKGTLKEQTLIEELRNLTKSIDGGDDLTSFTKGEMQDATMFSVAVGILHAPYETIEKGRLSNDPEIVAATKELENKALASQKKKFPLLRKDYFTFIKNGLWEKDIDVALSGSGNTILTFTGGWFAKNRNIKEFNENLYEMLRLLRFQKTQYRWYKSGDITYYDLKSPKDSEFAEL